jgi:hypothetical protein
LRDHDQSFGRTTALPAQAMPSAGHQLFDWLARMASRVFSSPRSRVIVVGSDVRLRLLVTELAAAGKEVSLIKPVTSATAQSKAPLGVSVIHSSRVGRSRSIARAPKLRVVYWPLPRTMP